MKIGILTQLPSYNYGGTLQCLALQNVLKEMGCDAEVIAFRSNNIGRKKAKLKLLFAGLQFNEVMSVFADKIYNCINSKLKRTRPLPQSMTKKNHCFIDNYISLTENCDECTIGELVKKHQYNAIVFGSDKIWSDLGMHQLPYFGDWYPKPECKLFSYAACSGKFSIPKYNISKIEKCLNRFSSVSVRDVQTKDLFQSFCEKEIAIVADPTLLYHFDEFKNCMIIDTPYILTYVLGREIIGGHKKIISKLKERHPDCIVVSIVLTTESTDIVKYSDRVIYDASPDEWVSLFFHATYVYTDSYHGTIFAMKYRKKFVSYYREFLRSSRLDDLKKRFLLSNIIGNSREFHPDDEIDYDELSGKVEMLKRKSLLFLYDSLGVF